MIDILCPVCGSKNIKARATNLNMFGKHIMCFDCEKFKCNVESQLLLDKPELKKAHNLIYEKLISEPRCKLNGDEYAWVFYYLLDKKDEEYISNKHNEINIAYYIDGYPANVSEKIDRVMMNLSVKLPDIGDRLKIIPYDYRLFFCDTDNQKEELATMIQYLSERGFIVVYKDQNEEIPKIKLTSLGWQHIEDLRKKNDKSKYGF